MSVIGKRARSYSEAMPLNGITTFDSSGDYVRMRGRLEKLHAKDAKITKESKEAYDARNPHKNGECGSLDPIESWGRMSK